MRSCPACQQLCLVQVTSVAADVSVVHHVAVRTSVLKVVARVLRSPSLRSDLGQGPLTPAMMHFHDMSRRTGACLTDVLTFCSQDLAVWSLQSNLADLKV